MQILYCPITGEKILTIGANGVMKRENYAEVWFNLSDGSRMRVAMSKNAKAKLTEKNVDALFSKIKKEWTTGIETKELTAKGKEIQLDRIEKLECVEVKLGEVIIKQK